MKHSLQKHLVVQVVIDMVMYNSLNKQMQKLLLQVFIVLKYHSSSNRCSRFIS